MGYFCYGCNIAFESTETVLDVKADDGNEFYHKTCYHGASLNIIRELKPAEMYHKAHYGKVIQRGNRQRVRAEEGHAQILEIIKRYGLITAEQIQEIQTLYTYNGLYSVLRLLVQKELITKTKINNRMNYAIKSPEIVPVALRDNLPISDIAN